MTRKVVVVTVTVLESGQITIGTAGPVGGTAGLVTLLEAARDVAVAGRAPGDPLPAVRGAYRWRGAGLPPPGVDGGEV